MDRVIAGATGLIGKRLAEHWLKKHQTLVIVGRSVAHIQEVFGTRVKALAWQDLTPDVLKNAEVVVNLAGANVAAEPWSDERKAEIISSRVDTTQNLAELLATLGPKAPPLFNASAIGVYGLQMHLNNQLPAPFDESMTFDWDNPPDFLSQVARKWERAAQPAIDRGVRVVFLRFGVVLAKEGGALPEIMKPFKLFVGGKIASGYQPFSWVSIDDVVRAIDYVFSHPDISGPVNIVSPKAVMQKELAEVLGRVLDRPALLKTPGFMLKYLFGSEMAKELLIEGQHVYPKRLEEAGFRFRYDDLETALNHVLK